MTGRCHSHICLPPCQRVRCLFVSRFVFPSQAVSPPVWPSICGSACLSPVCLHACLPRLTSPSPATAKRCVFIRLPRFGACPGEPLRRLIGGLARVKLIASRRRTFWQWYWWTGLWKMWHGIASCCNLMPALWSPNESHLSRRVGTFYRADQYKHVRRRVCVSCAYVSIYMDTHLCSLTVCACAWPSVCVCVTAYNQCAHTIYNMYEKLQRCSHCTVKSDYSSCNYSSHVYSRQCSLFAMLLM